MMWSHDDTLSDDDEVTDNDDGYDVTDKHVCSHSMTLSAMITDPHSPTTTTTSATAALPACYK